LVRLEKILTAQRQSATEMAYQLQVAKNARPRNIAGPHLRHVQRAWRYSNPFATIVFDAALVKSFASPD
jgi:hypothetical protein